MARLVTAGFETQNIIVETGPNAAAIGGTTPTIDTSKARSGLASLKPANGATNSYIKWGNAFSGVKGRNYFYRVWVYLEKAPAGSRTILRPGGTSENGLGEINVEAGNEEAATIWFWDGAFNVFKPEATKKILKYGQWNCIEVRVMSPEVGKGEWAFRLNGVELFSSKEWVTENIAPAGMRLGWLQAEASAGIWFDDIAINDDQGSNQNTWCGPAGKVVLLKPASDVSRTGWVGGAGGTTNLFDAVNNTPPIGVALASATNLSQIKDAENNATDTYEAKTAAFTTAVASGGGGMAATDIVTVAQALARGGNSTATARNFALVAANPTIGEVNRNTPTEAAGTETAGWGDLWSGVVYTPEVTLGNGCGLKVRKGTASTDSLMIDLLGLYVEYVSPVAITPSASPGSSSASATLHAPTYLTGGGATIAQQLFAAGTLDTLKHASQPSDLTLIPWAVTAGSWSATLGWSPPVWASSPPTGDHGGLYYNVEQFIGGNGYSILRRAGAFSNVVERQFSVYMFSAMGETASGYQVTAYESTTTADKFTLKLRKWVGGVETLLGEVAEVTVESTGAIAVVCYGGKVSMWVQKNESLAWAMVGSEVADATFTEGYAGFAGNGSNPRFEGFAAGELTVGIPLETAGTGATTLALKARTTVQLNPVGGAGGATLALITPPEVITGPASSVTESGATLNGEVDPNGAATKYFFEYGPTAKYGSKTKETSAGEEAELVPVSANISGLSPSTTYHYRLVAVNADGTRYGLDATFTTNAAPPRGAPEDERYVLDPTNVWLRHIKKGTSSSPGAQQLLGVYYYPDAMGLNGDLGFQSGQFERKLEEEGSFSIKLPNSAGQDGELHRERFSCISDPEFRPGDEWIEIWRGKELLFVGVPVSYELGFSTITVSGYSPFWLLKKTRETSAGYWVSAPRDALEHYLSLWQLPYATDFSGWQFPYAEETMSPGGDWRVHYGEAKDGSLVLRPPEAGRTASIFTAISAKAPFGAKNGHRCVRMEISFSLTGLVEGNSARFINNELGAPNIILSPQTGSTYGEGVTCLNADNPPLKDFVKAEITPGDHQLAIEIRDRWIYYYLDGKLVSALGGLATSKSAFGLGFLLEQAGASTMPIEATIHHIYLRHQEPFLASSANPGDYKLPGAPTAGGLEGHYQMDQDIWALTKINAASKVSKLLLPAREVDPGASEPGGLYQRRVDKEINFPAPGAAPNTWQPSGPANGEYFSCRWVGSIYLDLDNYDFALRETCDDRCRVWVGKTRLGEEYINDWNEAGHAMTVTTGTWLKAGSEAAKAPSGSTGQLAGMPSGWYPIVIEYSNGPGPGGLIAEFTRSDAVGTWQILGRQTGSFSSPEASRALLSPLGVYQDNVQYESHYEAFLKIAEAFGHQWTETPQSLESGLFPGYVSPIARVGRDTDYVLDSIEATEVGVQGNADDVADAILAEAQGLGDPSQAAQTTIEVFNLPGGDLYMAEEQESLSELNQEALILQRANSLLALHSSVWEEVGARPRGRRKLVDRFPLAGELAEFKWDPGDGLRLKFPEVLVDDRTPRQIQAITWPFVPDGLGIPNASFKQRPRNLLLTMRKMLRGSIAAQRNYQGQLVKVTGALAGNAGSSVDSWTRCPTPLRLEDLVKATFVVETKSDASEWQIEVNGNLTGIKFTMPGRYDITPWATRAAGTQPRVYARAINGTGTLDYVIELLVRV